MSAEPHDEVDEAVDGLPAERASDELFLHGLLQTVHSKAGDDADRRVKSLLSALSEKPKLASTRSSLRGRWAATVLSLAAGVAAVAIAGWAFFVPSNEVRAAEALQRAIAAAGRPVDREYRVTLWVDDGAPRAGRLWVRGSEKIAAEIPALLPANRGRTLWLGFNGKEAWFAPALPTRPVMVARGVHWLERWTKENGIDHPVLQVESVLRRLQSGHRLRTFVDDLGRTVIRAEGAIPHWVEIVPAKDGETVERLELSFDAGRRRLKVLLELVAEREDVDDGLYEHASHHDPGRKVIGAEGVR